MENLTRKNISNQKKTNSAKIESAKQVLHTVLHAETLKSKIAVWRTYGELVDYGIVRMENRMENFLRFPYGELYGELV